MPSQVNCKLWRVAPNFSWIIWLMTQKMILVWYKFNWKEVTSYFPGWLLRFLQCGQRKGQKTVTVYRQLCSYTDCVIRKYVLLVRTITVAECLLGHGSIWWWEKKNRVSQNSGAESWFLLPECPTRLTCPLLTLFWRTLIWIQV